MGTDSQGPARPLNAVVHRFDGHNDRIPHEVIALEAAGAIRVRLHVAFEDVVSFPDAETIVPWNFYAGPFDFDAPSAPPELLEALEPELHRFLFHHARVRLDDLQYELRHREGHERGDRVLCDADRAGVHRRWAL